MKTHTKNILTAFLLLIFNNIFLVYFVVQYKSHQQSWYILATTTLFMYGLSWYFLIKLLRNTPKAITNKFPNKNLKIVGIVSAINNFVLPILYYFYLYYKYNVSLKTLVTTPIFSVKKYPEETKKLSFYNIYNINDESEQSEQLDMMTLRDFCEQKIDNLPNVTGILVINKHIFDIFSYFVSQQFISTRFKMFCEDIEKINDENLSHKVKDRLKVYETILNDVTNKLLQYGGSKYFCLQTFAKQKHLIIELENKIIEENTKQYNNEDELTNAQILKLLKKFPKSYLNEWQNTQHTGFNDENKMTFGAVKNVLKQFASSHVGGSYSYDYVDLATIITNSQMNLP